ncbi:MAG: hypothetical protein CVU39_07980 [Chloroflexi bacterium HGW-Chloroflexi-10]|nr:MAG: hypothetical protein CVU39_07980 [Chloroflexi bacterium HGW-Chloroflexi-10]
MNITSFYSTVRLKYDPLPPLLTAENLALRYFVRRDVLGEEVGPVNVLWGLPPALRLLKKQQEDGTWPPTGEKKHPAVNYRLIETWRQFRCLVEQYGFTREHPKCAQTAEYFFSCQTPAGDIRGFLANQYATYYTGAIFALLIQAGYAKDERTQRGLQWLLDMRQDDQGWTIPILTHKLDGATTYRLTSEYAEPLEPIRSKPFSHHWTGMVLRAFAAHADYRQTPAILEAAGLLKSRFFQPDSYTSYQSAEHWLHFDYPFWWTNLVTALDSLSRIGLSSQDAQIQHALQWLIDHQEESGLWKTSYLKKHAVEKDTPKARETRLWVSLAICRIFKRFVDQD